MIYLSLKNVTKRYPQLSSACDEFYLCPPMNCRLWNSRKTWFVHNFRIQLRVRYACLPLTHAWVSACFAPIRRNAPSAAIPEVSATFLYSESRSESDHRNMLQPRGIQSGLFMHVSEASSFCWSHETIINFCSLTTVLHIMT